jgi:hypothetical protein
LAIGKQVKQLELNRFPSTTQKETPKKSKQIILTKIFSVTKFDEMILLVQFKLIPSKIFFSKLKSTLWFDGQEVSSALIRIPQRFGISDEFQLKSELDMRGISAGTHTIKVELHDFYSSCFGIKEKKIEYIPLDRKAGYRKIPMVKKIEDEGIASISESEKNIYQEMQETLKKDLDSSRDKW